VLNVYVDGWIENLKRNGDVCDAGCWLYTDGLYNTFITFLLLVCRGCLIYGAVHNILLYSSKTVSAIARPLVLLIAREVYSITSVCVDKQLISWVDQFKYLGVVFNVHGAVTADVLSIERGIQLVIS
jgi:hypothetical protein